MATNRRLIFMDKGIFSLRVEDFPYDKITSIEYSTGLAWGKLTIYASGNKAEITNVLKASVRPFAEWVRTRISSPSPARAAGPSVDVAGQLERLAALKEAGYLTAEELEAQKKKLLGF